MPLTPYPSLSTLPEVIANGGKIPSGFLAGGGGSGRTVYASAISGVVLDCNLTTGLTALGGAPTDNAAKLNAVLATATANAPVCLVVDGGCALSAPLVIPSTGHVAIVGQGWDTGFYMLSGSTASCIQNFPATDLASYQTWQPGAIQPIAGSNVHLAHFRIHGNRGTYPNGNCNGHRDGTLTDATALSSTPDARGPYPNVYWLSGIALKAVDNVSIDHVNIYDAPTYHVNLYHCTHVTITRCRIEAGNPSVNGNTDGIHLNGGCGSVTVGDSWFSTGDDAIGLNVQEGDGQPGSDFGFTNNTFINCASVARIYGATVQTRRVVFDGIRGTGTRAWAIQIGDSSVNPTVAESNHSILVRDCDLQVTGPSLGYGYSLIYVNSNVGLLELANCNLVEPTAAIPLVYWGDKQPTVSAVRVTGCGIHRNASGNAAATLFSANLGGTIGDLAFEDCHLTELAGTAYADTTPLIDLGKLTVNRLSLSGAFKGAGTVLNIPSTATVGRVVVPDLDHTSNTGTNAARSIVAAGSTVPVSIGRFSGSNLAGIASGTVALSGPGILSSGLAVADALMGNNSLYLGSDHAGVPCVKLAGIAKTVNLT